MADADPELDRLVAGHLDDALTPADAQRLHERLRREPEARGFLLAAARQATALPQLAVRPTARRGWRPRAIALAAAACLALSALGGWWLLARPEPVLRTDGAGVVVTRGDTAVAGPWLRAGDVLRTAERPAVLAWISETTRIELAPGTTCVVERDRGAKRLRLERGGLRADVAHQPADGGLAIVTPFGVVDVVGTRFAVQVGQNASQVSVDQGAVAVRSQEQSPPVRIQAGFTASLDGVQPPKTSPRLQRPVTTPAQAPTAPAISSEVSARDWIADGGVGWEGGLGEGDVLSSQSSDPDWARLLPPTRAAPGYARYDRDMVCEIEIAADRPATLALVLIIASSSDGLWQGNLQAEQPMTAGRSTMRFPVSAMRSVAGFADELPADCMVASFAVMSWNPRTDFTVRRIRFGPGR